MKKFEYKIVEAPAGGFFGGRVKFQDLTDKLNDLGKQGWEAVNTVDTNLFRGGTRSVVVILKRELS